MFNRIREYFWPSKPHTAVPHPPTRPVHHGFADADKKLTDQAPVERPRDMLGLLQDQLDTRMHEYNTALEEWNKLEIDILAGSVQADDEMLVQRRKSFWEQIREQLKRIKEAAESASDYLYDMLEATSKEITPIQTRLHTLLEISDFDFANLAPEEKKRHLVLVCNKAIAILYGLEVMINHFISEIDYCLYFEGNWEKYRDKGIKYIASDFLQMNLPEGDHEQEFALYRMKLYSNIADPAGDIAAFIARALADVQLAKRFVTEKQWQLETKPINIDLKSNLFKPAETEKKQPELEAVKVEEPSSERKATI